MLRAACIALVWATQVAAQDYIRVTKPLSDDAFYRLVACGAAPTQKCENPFVRWTDERAKTLSVGITRVDDTYPAAYRAAADRAVERAITQINAAGTVVQFRRDDDDPILPIMLLDLQENSTITGTGIQDVDGNTIEAAYVHIWWNGRRELTHGLIIITPFISPADIDSVMLEEMVQSLGLLTDVAGPAYAGRSIFAQDDNDTRVLRGQDLMVVRRHYANGQ